MIPCRSGRRGALTILVLLAAFTAARAETDIERHRGCERCGMDRKAYGYSRMLVSYAEGLEVGVCSLRCAVIAMSANPTRQPQAIAVADRETRELIVAERAAWVMGGKKRGVMTQRPKWAFLTRDAAAAFIAANGGTLATWEEALAAAREEIAAELRSNQGQR